MDDATRTELEAAAFRRLRDHLNARTDVQNIDMMNLTGFCRNCLSRWYQEAAEERGIAMTKDEGREAFYGMPFRSMARPPPDRRHRCTKGRIRQIARLRGSRVARLPAAPVFEARKEKGTRPASCRVNMGRGGSSLHGHRLRSLYRGSTMQQNG